MHVETCVCVCVFMCAYVCMCVCVCWRGRRPGGLSMCVCVDGGVTNIYDSITYLLIIVNRLMQTHIHTFQA